MITASASSGIEGLDVARKELTGLVLIGLEMPEMSEPEFLRELRKDRRDIPAVIVIG